MLHTSLVLPIAAKAVIFIYSIWANVEDNKNKTDKENTLSRLGKSIYKSVRLFKTKIKMKKVK